MSLCTGGKEFSGPAGPCSGRRKWIKSGAFRPDLRLKQDRDLNHLFIAGHGRSTPAEYEHLKADGRSYRFDVYWHGDEVILAHYDSPEQSPLGGTLLTVNGRPATGLLLQLSRYLPAEGQAGNRFELERPVVLQQMLWSETR